METNLPTPVWQGRHVNLLEGIRGESTEFPFSWHQLRLNPTASHLAMPDLVQQTEITAFRGKPWKTHIPKKKNKGKTASNIQISLISSIKYIYIYMALSQHVAEHPYLETHKTHSIHIHQPASWSPGAQRWGLKSSGLHSQYVKSHQLMVNMWLIYC